TFPCPMDSHKTSAESDLVVTGGLHEIFGKLILCTIFAEMKVIAEIVERALRRETQCGWKQSLSSVLDSSGGVYRRTRHNKLACRRRAKCVSFDDLAAPPELI